MTANPDAPTPHRYQEIASELHAAIERGDFPEGSRLPSENDLMRDYNVARNTARDALAVLKREGLAVARQGSGTIVGSPDEPNAITSGREPLRTFRIPDDIYLPAQERARLNDESLARVVRRALKLYADGDWK